MYIIKKRSHAYLIVGHEDENQIRLLIEELDYEKNDIYLLIDSKSIIKDIEIKTEKSNILFIRDHEVNWGSFSQIEALQKLLISAKLNGNYFYYHYISASDFPISSQKIIHSFFEKNPGRIFVTYSIAKNKSELTKRTYRYNFDNHFRPRVFIFKILNKIWRKIELFILSIFSECRLKSNELEFGSNWVSFDDEFAAIILEEIEWSIEIFKNGFLVDELYIQSLIEKRKLKHKVYHSNKVTDDPDELQGNLRYINWWDGTPYIWDEKNIEDILKARKLGHLFIRKVNSEKSSELLYKIKKMNNME